MALNGIDELDFKRILKRHFTPGRAISSTEYLRGREAKLRQIDRAFNSDGKHIFIHGDRGVGKTSLARTAAFIYSSADGEPPIVECEASNTAYQLLRDIALRCVPPAHLTSDVTTRKGFKSSIPLLGGEVQQEIKHGRIPEIKTINDALTIVGYVASLNQKEPVVVIDEFDVIEDKATRHTIASFLKHVSDQEIGLRFIICGIGHSLDEMIGAHLSTGRYLLPVPLERLPHDARWEIIGSVARELDVVIDDNTLIRTGQVSDGFPYYVHLIGEKLFWAIWDSESTIAVTMPEHFDNALREASIEAEPSLKTAYEAATKTYTNDFRKYTDDFQHVLWAVADDSSLARHTNNIYESYCRFMASNFSNKKMLTLSTFSDRLRQLNETSHKAILLANGGGWYEFRENRLRGYVRLVAERAGVQLEPEHYLGGKLHNALQDYHKHTEGGSRITPQHSRKF